MRHAEREAARWRDGRYRWQVAAGGLAVRHAEALPLAGSAGPAGRRPGARPRERPRPAAARAGCHRGDARRHRVSHGNACVRAVGSESRDRLRHRHPRRVLRLRQAFPAPTRRSPDSRPALLRGQAQRFLPRAPLLRRRALQAPLGRFRRLQLLPACGRGRCHGGRVVQEPLPGLVPQRPLVPWTLLLPARGRGLAQSMLLLLRWKLQCCAAGRALRAPASPRRRAGCQARAVRPRLGNGLGMKATQTVT